MPQVSLYVDALTLESLREEAAREGVSLSRHVAARLEDCGRRATRSGLPEGYLDSLYGCLANDDSFARPEQPGFTLDASRLAFD